jgi:ubiquinone/menaquinone biosynthesis C-methylase UbiE
MALNKDDLIRPYRGLARRYDLTSNLYWVIGKIIGVDMSDAMLARARARISRQGWSNVELVQSDVAQYVFRAS